MNMRGGGGPSSTPSGTSGTSSTSGVPLACNQVRIISPAGGILECVTYQEACARGIVTDASICAVQVSNANQLSGVAQVSGGVVTVPSVATGGNFGACVSCGGLIALLLIADLMLGTGLIFRRKKAA